MDRSTQALNTKVTVLITDDHAVVRKGIRALLMTEPDIEVIGEAENGHQAVVEAARLQPDVILMDIVMPKMDGIEAIRRISARQPAVRILVLTSFATDEKVFPAIKAGALGYLLKDSEPEALIQAIHQVYRREPSLHPTIAKKVLQELSRSTERKSRPEQLTVAEIDVLRLVARGQRNQEIAHQLQINETAVPLYIKQILRKLHLASRTQAVLYALREGLASLNDAAPDDVSRLLAALPDAGTDTSSELEALRQIAADYEAVGQELVLAGEIQTSFLPDTVPTLAGWQLTATLEPAKETSGDFYDFIPLPEGRLGLLIADVVGKGMGAALYMALSRTLIRTYAIQYDTQPELALSAANHRIQMDTQANMFVTAFYGILDPQNGSLTYSNAGHNPPYLLSAKNREEVQPLIRTGVPLGMLEDMTWKQNRVQLAPGDMLLLYTDGVTEAQNQQEVFFGAERLLTVAQTNLGCSAQAVQEALLASIYEFSGTAPNAWRDDITVMVVVREP